MNWYINVLKKYAVFSGRARRTEYWMVALYNSLFTVIAIILDNIFGIAIKEVGYGPIYIIYMLAMILPILALTVRRLHDVGKSGWFLFISLIPIVGGIWLFVLFCSKGTAGDNIYGANPKDMVADQTEDFSLIRDSIILFVFIFMVLSRTYWALIPRLIDDWYMKFKMPTAFLNMTWGIIPIVLSFSIKNKSQKLVLLIIGIIYLLYQCFEVGKELFRNLN